MPTKEFRSIPRHLQVQAGMAFLSMFEVTVRKIRIPNCGRFGAVPCSLVALEKTSNEDPVTKIFASFVTELVIGS